MKEIDANKHAWGQVSEEHYYAFKRRFLAGEHRFNPYIEQELGLLHGKDVIHLQCNTGADTILLAQKANSAVGVDLVPDNIRYATLLAADLGVANARFIESDIMDFMDKHDEKYDVVFVSEGAVCWLPDLVRWAKTIRHLLRDGGFFYMFDSHPFFMMLDETKLAHGEYDVKYPYFGKAPDVDDSIGGYASERKYGVEAYSWQHTVGDYLNALAGAGMHVEFFHEFEENFFDSGGLTDLGGGLYNIPLNTGKFPMSFSLRATPTPRK